MTGMSGYIALLMITIAGAAGYYSMKRTQAQSRKLSFQIQQLRKSAFSKRIAKRPASSDESEGSKALQPPITAMSQSREQASFYSYSTGVVFGSNLKGFSDLPYMVHLRPELRKVGIGSAISIGEFQSELTHSSLRHESTPTQPLFGRDGLYTKPVVDVFSERTVNTVEEELAIPLSSLGTTHPDTEVRH